ncbi:MAG: alanine-zipper protein [Candidatus Binataceae bacterium]
MKKLAWLLGLLATVAIISACGPNMDVVNQSTQKAESDASRAQAAAQSAEQSSQSAQTAANQASQQVASAEDSVNRANDAVRRLEAAFSTSVMK